MERRRKQLDAQAMERAVNQIRGVYAAQVVLGSADSIDEIHVIASPLRKPKQVVRDIESMLLVNFGVRVDYRRISLVQMEEQRLFQAEGRPRLAAVRTLTGVNGRAEVDLEREGKVFTGWSQGGTDDGDMMRLVSEATLKALEQVLGERVSYNLDHIDIINLGPLRAVAVAVSVNFPSGVELLMGISHLREDMADTAARATLSAVNRRLLVVKPEVGER